VGFVRVLVVVGLGSAFSDFCFKRAIFPVVRGPLMAVPDSPSREDNECCIRIPSTFFESLHKRHMD
jgi:hypothetical protein